MVPNSSKTSPGEGLALAIEVPDAFVVAAARAISKVDWENGWSANGEISHAQRTEARAAFAAVLAMGDVRQEWRTAYQLAPNASVIGSEPYTTKEAAIGHAKALDGQPMVRRDGTIANATAWAETCFIVTFPDGVWTGAWRKVTEDAAT